LLRYGIVVGVAAIALLLRVFLQPIPQQQVVFVLFTLTVMLSAGYGGLGPGLLATAGTAFIATFFFLGPGHSLSISPAEQVMQIALFVMVGVGTSWLADEFYWARKSAGARRQEREVGTRTTIEPRSEAIALPGSETEIRPSLLSEQKSRLLRYGIVVGVAGLALLLRVLLQPVLEQQAVFLLFALSVMVSAAYGGLGPGLFATAGTTAIATFFYLGPGHHLSVSAAEQEMQIALFVMVGVATSWLADELHWAKITAKKNATQMHKSEARFRALIEHSSDAIALGSYDGRIVYASPSMSRVLGYSLDEIVGQKGIDFIDPDDHARLQRLLVEMLLHPEQGITLETRVRHKNGSWRWVESVATNLLHDPSVGAIVFNFRDITERRRTELALRGSEDRYRAITETASDGIITFDEQGKIVFANKMAVKIFGYESGDLLRQDLDSLMPDYRQCVHSASLEPADKNSPGVAAELAGLRKDGGQILLEMSFAEFLSDGRRYYTALFRDITQRKYLDEQMRQTQKLESLGVLAGGVAHDFNNLLVSIMGNASLALEALPQESPANSRLQDLVQAAKQAAHLTGQLLAYAGKGRFLVQPIDLSAFVTEAANLLQLSIPKNVDLRLQLADGLPAIEADVGQMQQLVMNLVINGAEAIPEDRAGTVLVTTAVQEVTEGCLASSTSPNDIKPGTYVMLKVQDTGIGMAEDTRARIFDPFFTTKFTGRGLGLAAVLGIVRGHKGALQVDSTPGRGSTFKVLFPALQVRAEKAARADEENAVPSEKLENLRGTRTILVVDDEEKVRRAVGAMLERYGYKVMLAPDGERAVDLFRNAGSQISLVLLDLTMPVMSGEETLRELKKIRPEVRVILSSGYNEVEAVRHFSGRGLSGFLQKPYTLRELAEKMKSALAE
jgi:PAS domain S-box-containing protein